MEVPVGFEPTNGGFANRCVRPLHHGTLICQPISFIKNTLKMQLTSLKSLSPWHPLHPVSFQEYQSAWHL